MPELNVTNGWQVRNAEYDLLSGGYPLSQAIPATAERDAGDVVYASLVCVTIAKGRIKDIDASAAFRINGVVSILTHQNLPHMTEDQFDEEGTIPLGSSFQPLHDDEIVFNGQPVALVVARTLEIARLAASLVRVEYRKQASTDGPRRGEVPTEHHSPIEGDAATAVFEESGKLSIRHATQVVQPLHRDLGTHFSSGLYSQFHVMLAARAALALRCSVRLVLTRRQMHDLATSPRSSGESSAAPFRTPRAYSPQASKRNMSTACAA